MYSSVSNVLMIVSAILPHLISSHRIYSLLISYSTLDRIRTDLYKPFLAQERDDFEKDQKFQRTMSDLKNISLRPNGPMSLLKARPKTNTLKKNAFSTPIRNNTASSSTSNAQPSHGS